MLDLIRGIFIGLLWGYLATPCYCDLWSKGGIKADLTANDALNELNEIELINDTKWRSAKAIKAKRIGDSLKMEKIAEPEAEYRYGGFDQPNPFFEPDLEHILPSGKIVPADLKKSKDHEIPIVNKLQMYPLNRLKVKGIWHLDSGVWRAIIMTPEKEGIVVKKGDPIYAGEIIAIDNKKITTRQYRMDPSGVRTFKDVALYLGDAPKKIGGNIKLSPGKDPVINSLDKEHISKDSAILKQPTPEKVDKKSLINDKGTIPKGEVKKKTPLK